MSQGGDGPALDSEPAGGEGTPCECGALTPCEVVWHEALAHEQTDARMYSWHLPLVCTFLLQHGSHCVEHLADGQFRLLQLYLDRGIEAVHRLQRHQVRRNRSGVGFDAVPLTRYATLDLAAGFPPRFAVSVHDLKGAQGGFRDGGHEAYGERMHRLAEATVQAWLVRSPGRRPGMGPP